MLFPKTTYIRSPALMRAFRSIECQNCGRDDGSVCGAHSNRAQDGKGRSIKASDDSAASLCSVCHYAIDQGKDMSREHRFAVHAAARVKTVRALVARGLWPRGLAVPDIPFIDAN